MEELSRSDRKAFKQPFYDWTGVKIDLAFRAKVVPIHEGEIWWYGAGKNVGVEINGKGELFSRPVLVFHTFGKLSFLGIPLTTKPKAGSWYIPFSFHGINQVAVLSQARTISTHKLYKRMGSISDHDFRRVSIGFARLFCKNIPRSPDQGNE